MNDQPNMKSLRERSICFDMPALLRSPSLSLFLILLSLTMTSCGGSGEKAAETPDASAIRTESKDVFAPAWSTNAAPPPEPGGIREIGSVLDGLPQGTFGTPTAQKPVAPRPSGPVDPSAANWTIAVAVFRGETQQDDAGKALARVRNEGGLPEAYLQRRGPSTLIAYGKYAGPSDSRAQSDLTRIQQMQVGGTAAFTGAYLCPPYQGQIASQLREYDLRRAKATYGAQALYTLQIGWYGREDMPRTTEADLKESRKAAEEAAERLRREGELAFFFHGPNRSMVTVGVFDSSDFDPVKQPGLESARLKDARRRHPLNLYNGAGYSYKSPGMREAKLLPSGLVAIPAR